MTNAPPDDEALAVLRQVFELLTPAGIPWAVVERCYLVQRKHQYEADRELAVNEMRTIIASCVENDIQNFQPPESL
jgi:hypothetical protein